MYTKKLFTKSFIACANTLLKSAKRFIQAATITDSITAKNPLHLLPFPQRQRRIQTIQQVRFTSYEVLNIELVQLFATR
jgi:hypothetical protein